MSFTETGRNFSNVDEFLNTMKSNVPLWVLGTEEEYHQAGLINVFQQLSSSHPQMQEISRRLAMLMWMQNPLARKAADICLKLNPVSGALSRMLSDLTVAPVGSIPEDDLKNLLQSGDSGLIIRYLFPFLRGPQGLLWLSASWDTLLRLGNPELPLNALELVNWPDGFSFSQLRQRLKVEYNFLYHSPETTLAELDSLDDEIWSLWKNYMRAELLLRSGARGEGTARLSSLWKDNIWNINWGLKLYALLNPVNTDHALDNSAEVSILLYSWNNGQLIEKTLKNVSNSRTGAARIFALNNGSDDKTGEVVANAGRLFAAGKYKGIQLPVNVGAPPARNWLLSEPEVRRSGWAVFLDDDVELPENWLEELLATARHHGSPGAVGCRITSAAIPRSLQSADYHLFHPGNGTSQIEGLTERIKVFDSCRNGFDFGQFSYSRPAVHVSGCCHMLNMEAIHKCGGFDIRFNPTQFDDLERDLRAHLAGYTHIYAGQLGIGHIQHSSLAKASTLRSMAQVFGNKIKLESKYTEHDLNNIFSRDLGMLWTDTEKKWRELAG